MSNLIKNVYFTVDESDKRVIDSDIHGKDVHPEIYEQQQDDEIKPFNFRQLSLDEETDDENLNSQIDDFNEGMNIISVDEVREEEKQKLSELSVHNACCASYQLASLPEFGVMFPHFPLTESERYNYHVCIILQYYKSPANNL